MLLQKNEKIVVVGAGCFGVSTAYHLLQRGYLDVTILDRSTILPAPDAASNDINRVVRSSYSDRIYAELAREAILSWKDQEKWGDTYHEELTHIFPRSGVLVIASPDSGEKYVNESYRNDVALGAVVERLENSDQVRSMFPPNIRIATFSEHEGYLNRDGGWANAGQGLSILLNEVIALKGKVLPGKSVHRILRHNGKIIGVQCADESVFDAGLVIIATGSWTSSAFPDLDLAHICLATGEGIAMVQLSEQEAKAYKNCPVILDLSSGFYIFPPNEANVVKFAFHSAGYTNEVNSISTPHTVTSDPVRGLLIPKAVARDLRIHLKNVYPDLAEKPFCATRLCWYNDSPDGDWVIGKHPSDDSIILATGGSGHAYKFLPVIGRLVADLVEEKLDPVLRAKFAIQRKVLGPDPSRSGAVLKLDLDQLCTPADLDPKHS